MLDDYRSLVTGLVRDTERISAADVDQAVRLAVTRYSTDRPRVFVEDVAADGGCWLDLPAGWQPGASRLLGLETELGNVPPVQWPSDTFEVYAGPAGERIMLGQALAAGEMVRLRYSIPHAVSDAEDTVPEYDREAVASWAAAHLLDILANDYAGNHDQVIQADSVQHGSRSRDYARRADDARQAYLDHLGVDEKRTVAAGAVVTLHGRDSRGQRRLLHRRSGPMRRS